MFYVTTAENDMHFTCLQDLTDTLKVSCWVTLYSEHDFLKKYLHSAQKRQSRHRDI